MQNNSKEDILPLASVNLDCCLTEVQRDQLQNIPLQKPLTYVLSSVDELNIAGVKISEVQELIKKEQAKKFEHFKILTHIWGGIVLTFLIFVICTVKCRCNERQYNEMFRIAKLFLGPCPFPYLMCVKTFHFNEFRTFSITN